MSRSPPSGSERRSATERGLVAWLAPGTLQESQGAPDGQRVRTVPLARRWLEERTRIVEEWWGNGVPRTDHDTHSSDHILDAEISPDGTVHLKDEDELAAAIEQGRLSPDQAAQIERQVDAAIATFEAGDWPFDDEWRGWRPDPAWTVPELARLDALRREE